MRTAVRAAAGAASRADRGLATCPRRHAARHPGRRCGLPSELPRAQPVGQIGAWQPVCGDTPHVTPAGGADCRPSCRGRSQSGRSGLGNLSAATRRTSPRQAVRTAVRAAAGAASRADRGLATCLRRHAARHPGRRCGLPSELPRAQPVGQIGAWQPVCGDTPLTRPRRHAAFHED